MNTTTNNNNGLPDSMTILKELSDIKLSLGINTNETQNIKATIGEIKVDVKSMKNDYPNRRELTESIAGLREEIAPLKKFIIGIISAIGLVLVGAVMKLVLKI